MEADDAIGCVALKHSSDSAAELKRLYVRPEARGRGIGRMLVEAVLAEAVELGYRRIRLDTVPEMSEAISLYRAFGFRPIPAYRSAPQENALYFELELA
jgi:ribosomal protein S18 acetylase RimI-like enzyme